MKIALLNIVFTVLSIIFTILGFIGYYGDLHFLLILFFIFYVVDTSYQLMSKQLNNINTAIVSAVIGIIIALIFKLNVFDTILVSLCFESAIMSLFGIGFMFLR